MNDTELPAQWFLLLVWRLKMAWSSGLKPAEAQRQDAEEPVLGD